MMTSPSSSFIGNMLMKATFPVAGLHQSIDSQNLERYRLLVIGDNDCGKTCLLNAFVKSDFEVDESPSGVFEECTAPVRIGTRQIEFMLWDLSGHEDYDGLRVELYRDADVFLVCFDIGNPDSLKSADDMWIQEIKDEAPETPFILIGCKNDLRTDANIEYFLSVPGMQNETENTESVDRPKAEKIAAESGAKDYLECCAKTRFNISEVFKSAAHAVLSKNDPSFNSRDKNFGLKNLSRYARRRSTEVQERLQVKKGKPFFSPEKNGRRGTIF